MIMDEALERIRIMLAEAHVQLDAAIKNQAIERARADGLHYIVSQCDECLACAEGVVRAAEFSLAAKDAPGRHLLDKGLSLAIAAYRMAAIKNIVDDANRKE